MKHFLLVGGTGVGKSSTINALAHKNGMARIGHGSKPETQKLMGYKVGDYVLWDTPGLGEGIAEDERHIESILGLAHGSSKYNIHHVLLVIEANKRDLGGVYKVVEILVKSRYVAKFSIIMNQADQAMKGQNWNCVENGPNVDLKEYLDEQAVSFKDRVEKDTGVELSMPKYYSALTGYGVEELDDFIRQLAAQ